MSSAHHLTGAYPDRLNQLAVHFLDVGQADSILLELPGGRYILIDAGNNADGPFIIAYLKYRGIARIDYLIATHPHEDHIGGMDEVIESFSIGRVFMPPVTHTTDAYHDLLQALDAGSPLTSFDNIKAFNTPSTNITPAEAGMKIINDDENDLQAFFLSPSRDDYEELNEWSAVLKVEYGETSFLFTGDAEEVNEVEMITAYGEELDSDVLKVGHHGSDSSTCEAFVEAVNPVFAVISVGANNPYDHPSLTVIDRLKKNGAIVLRTDELGTIIARSDGKTINFYKLSFIN